MSGTDFLIAIEQQMRGDNPVTELQKTASALTEAMGKYKELEKTSANASKALEKSVAGVADVRAKMQSAMDAGDKNAIAKLGSQLMLAQGKQKELAQAATAAASALKAQEAPVTSLANKLKQLQTAEKGAADAAKQLATAEKAGAKASEDAANAAEASEKARLDSLETNAKVGDGLTKLGGPLGSLGGKAKQLTEGWKDLSSKMGSGNAAMLVGAAAAAALVVALVAATAAAVKFAISSANASRDSALMTEAFMAQVGGSKELADSMSKVTKETGIAGDRQKEIIKSLQEANVSASDLPAALKAIATQEAALGDSSGTSKIVEDLKAGKKSVAEMAKEMDSKFGGIAKKRMMGLDQQTETLQRNIAGLFAGINIEAVLAGIQKLVALFDSSTASGKALKSLIEAVFKPLEKSGGIFVKIERFMLGMISQALSVGIAVKKMASFFGFDLGSLEDLPDVATLGKIAIMTLMIPFIPLAIVIGVVVGAFLLLRGAVRGFLVVASALGGAVSAMAESIVGPIKDLPAKFMAIATAAIDGFVSGIKNGIGKVEAVLQVLGAKSGAAMKNAIDAHSPSRMFAEIGGFIPAGMAVGIDDGTDDVNASIGKMIDAPSAVPGVAAAASAAGGGTVTIGSIIINGVDGAANMIDQLAAELERVLFQSGAPTT